MFRIEPIEYTNPPILTIYSWASLKQVHPISQTCPEHRIYSLDLFVSLIEASNAMFGVPSYFVAILTIYSWASLKHMTGRRWYICTCRLFSRSIREPHWSAAKPIICTCIIGTYSHDLFVSLIEASPHTRGWLERTESYSHDLFVSLIEAMRHSIIRMSSSSILTIYSWASLKR